MGKKRKKIKPAIKIARISIILTEANPIKNKMLNPNELHISSRKGFSFSLIGYAEYNHAKIAPIRTNANICLEAKSEMNILRNKIVYENITAVLNGIVLFENKFCLSPLYLIFTSKHSFKEYPWAKYNELISKTIVT